jgi:hypothetical protein
METERHANARSQDTFREYSPNMNRLHTAGFEIRNVKLGEFIIDKELVTHILSESPDSLRRLRINTVQAEVTLVVFLL